jgi:hypothetical protein
MIYYLLSFLSGITLGIILNIYQAIFTEIITYLVYYSAVLIGIVYYITYTTGIELKNTYIEIIYNCIYYFSKLQLFVNKLKNKMPFLSKLSKLYEYLNPPVVNKKTIIEYNKEYGFFIHNNCVNGINYIQILSTNEEKEWVVSQISFLLLECIINGDVYKIDLKKDYFNYYIVGNELNKLFFIYYIKTYINSNINISENSKYSIKLIDGNADIVELDFDNEKSKIIIDKTSHTIRQH